MRKEGIADGYVGRRHAAQGEEEHEVDVRGEVAAGEEDHRHYFFGAEIKFSPQKFHDWNFVHFEFYWQGEEKPDLEYHTLIKMLL